MIQLNGSDPLLPGVGSNPLGIGARESAETRKRQETARLVLEKAWHCELHPFGKYCPIDYYATRHGEMAALIEIKTRAEWRSMVFLNVRKELALRLGQVSLGVPAIFVYMMGDDVFYTPLDAIDPRRMRLGGQRTVEHHTDYEPVIEVDTALFWSVPR